MMCAAAMGKARGDEAYFQRSSLFWVTIIILSFGYYTVRTAGPEEGEVRGWSAAWRCKIPPGAVEWSQARSRLSGALSQGTRPGKKTQAHSSVYAFRLC